MNATRTFEDYMYDRIRKDDRFMAYYLEAYARDEGLAPKDLHEFLNAGKSETHFLGLCNMPDKQAEDFAVRVHNLAELAGVDPKALQALIRDVLITEKFRLSTKSNPIRSQLMAAKDRENTDQEEE